MIVIPVVGVGVGVVAAAYFVSWVLCRVAAITDERLMPIDNDPHAVLVSYNGPAFIASTPIEGLPVFIGHNSIHELEEEFAASLVEQSDHWHYLLEGVEEE